MNNKELFYFTGKCLALDENPAFKSEIIEKCKNDLIEWEQFVGLCNNHLILPAIYLKFQSHGIIEYLPEELAEFLKEVHHLNSVRNKQILLQLQEIMNILNEHEIFPTLLKGAGNLLDGLYADVGERILGDIDFLVPEKDYLLSAELLESKGYTKFNDIPKYDDVESLKHYPRLSHLDFVASIEIHRIPVNVEYVSWFNSATIYSERKSVTALDGCFVESDHHKIIHNFVHSQLSNEGFLFGSVSLREMYDLYLLSRRFPLAETIPHIKAKQKAIAYFAFSRLVLGLDESFFSGTNFAYQILLKKHSLNQNSTFFYNSHRSLIFMAQRIFTGYIGQILKAFYSKDKRNYLLRRINDPKWYADHIGLYSRFFIRNK
ncbi:MAG: nucleotidyltransferase family protein [Prolixibacteraceae bacterium]|nr:nucleotidyltransferase family protein [Prolixibacteraceae bacterium]